jgi:hypothetical protein
MFLVLYRICSSTSLCLYCIVALLGNLGVVNLFSIPRSVVRKTVETIKTVCVLLSAAARSQNINNRTRKCLHELNSYTVLVANILQKRTMTKVIIKSKT